MKKLSKKRVKLLIGLGMIGCLSLFLFRHYSQEEVVKANPTEEITIDKGTSYEQKIPVDTILGIQEETLKNNNILPNYAKYNQSNNITSSIYMEDKLGYPGTKANDNVVDMYVTKDNKFIMLISSSNYNSFGYDQDKIVKTSVVMFDETGNIIKILDRPEFTFGDNTRMYQNKVEDQYVIFNSQKYTTYDSNLNKIGETTYASPSNADGLYYGRTSLDYDGTSYLLSYKHFLNSTRRQGLKGEYLNGYIVDNTTTELTNPIKFQTLSNYVGSYEKVTGNSTAPVAAFEGFVPNGLTKMKDKTYVGLYTLSNESASDSSYYYLVHWDSEGNVISYFDIEAPAGATTVLNNLQDGRNFYFRSFSSNEILNYSLDNNSIDVVLKLTTSRLTINAISNDTLSIIGQSPLVSYFSSYYQGDTSSKFVISSGKKDNLFQVEKTLSLTGVQKYSNLLTQSYSEKKVSKATIFNDANFSVSSIQGFQDGSEIKYGYARMVKDRTGITPPTEGWPDKYSNTFNSVSYGILNNEEDYAPAINVNDYVLIDKDNSEYVETQVNNNGWTPLENQLVTGSVNGLISDDNAVKVYDNFDINYAAVPITVAEFTKKINRNPNDLSAPIDWKSLGFDLSKLGGQRVTYFITDSQKQITSTSRNVNVVDNKTAYDETTAKAALHAENFALDLKNVSNLTADNLINQSTTDTYGKVLAWDLETGDNYNTEVTVNETQLAAINAAEKFGKFPLTYTLTKNGKTLTRETIVYVMGENSEQVGKNGTTIFNTDPISLPWDLTSTLSESDLGTKVMTDGNVIAYDFETGEDITSKVVRPTVTVVSPVKVDIAALQDVEPTDKKNPPTTANPTKVVHYEITRDTAEETATTTKGTTVTVYYRFVTVTINSTDEDGNALYDTNDKPLTYKKDDKTLTIDPIVLEDQIVGKTINFTTLASIIDSKTAATNGTGYEFVDYFNSDNTTKVTTPNAVPIQWKDPEATTTTDPNVYILQYKGTLRFLAIPETMAFDSKLIRAFDQESVASTTNEDLVVGDNRKTSGTSAVKGNWKVNVNLVSDFTLQGEGATATLPDILYYGDTLITKTAGTTIKTNDTAITKTDIPLDNTSNFKLKIPAGKAQSGTYQAIVNWGLTNAP